MPAKFTSLTPALHHYIMAHHSGSRGDSQPGPRSAEPEDELLRELRHETEKLGGISQMLISAEQGTLLSLLVAATGARAAIEVGTFTGYSAICIARGLMPGGTLLCCDISDEWPAVGRPFWQRAGLEGTIELRAGDATQTLQALPPEQVFDFAFVDADKTGYDTYYELLLPRLKPNALIIFDNMLRDGRVANESLTEPDDVAIDALNRKLARDERVQAVLLPVADGLQICRKRAAG